MERIEKAVAVLPKSDAKLRQERREWALAQLENVMRTLSLSRDAAVEWMRASTPTAYAHLIGKDAPQIPDKRAWAERQVQMVMEQLKLDLENALVWMREHTSAVLRLLI
jgi:hypothetical protein